MLYLRRRRAKVAATAVATAIVAGLVAVVATNGSPARSTRPPGTQRPAAVRSVAGGITFGTDYEVTLEHDRARARTAVMDAMKAAGVSWVRIDGPNLSEFDAVIRSARRARLHVDLVVQSWYVGTTPGAVAALGASLARKYGRLGVTTYEILNEPNNYNPVLSPAAYTTILKAAYRSVHTVLHSATVLIGGIGNPSSGLDAYAYLAGMYAAGAQGYFDAVNIHPYAFPDLPSTDNPDFNPWQYMPMGWGTTTCPDGVAMNCVEAMMAAHGDGAKKIWLTEFGAPTGPDGFPPGTGYYSDAFQAESISEAFADARSSPNAGPLFNFQWQDDAEGDFGLLTASGAAKPALAAFTDGVDGSNPPSMADNLTNP